MASDFIRYSVNLNCRDKSLKVIQYGCRLMMGYYNKTLSTEGMEKLKGTLNMTLLIRRASRLFIFMTNLYNMSNKLKKFSKKNTSKSILAAPRSMSSIEIVKRQSWSLVGANDYAIVEALEVLEQLFWSLFFILDTYIGFIRLGAVAADQDKLQKLMEEVYFPLWFAPDFCVFLKTFARLHFNSELNALIEHELLSLRLNANIDTKEGELNVGNEVARRRVALVRLTSERKRLYWVGFKSLLDMGVSASFIPRTGAKKVLGEGFVGLFGMTSALMAIVDEIYK